MESEVREFLDNYPAKVQEIALALRGIVFDLVPETRERVYTGWRIISFSFRGGTDGQFCAIQPNKGAGRVNLHFPAGVELADPGHLLEGDGKRMRHIKVTAVDNESFVERIQALITEAAAKERP
jgi:hypothetical protein